MVFLISGSLVLTFVPWNHEATTIEGEFVLGQALNLLCFLFFFFVSSLLSFGAGPYVRLNILCTLRLG